MTRYTFEGVAAVRKHHSRADNVTPIIQNIHALPASVKQKHSRFFYVGTIFYFVPRSTAIRGTIYS